MTNEELTASLQGQIEGLAQALLVLGATLQARGVLDAQLYQANLRRRAEQLPPGRYGLAETQRLMTRLADELLHVAQHGRKHGQSAALHR